MKRRVVAPFFSTLLLALAPVGGHGSPQTFPEFPDSPNPGGESNGGDRTPPYVYREEYFLSKPIIFNVGMSNGRISFQFNSRGPVMRYNVVWSRPGKEQSAGVWHDSNGFEEDNPEPRSKTRGYVIPERPQWDTEYAIKVQAQTWWWRNISSPQITPFEQEIFRTPPNPAIRDKLQKADQEIFLKQANPKRLTKTAVAAIAQAFDPQTEIESKDKLSNFEINPLMSEMSYGQEIARNVSAAPAVRLAGGPTTSTKIRSSSAVGILSAGQSALAPSPIVAAPEHAVPTVFSPPLLEDKTLLWACPDAAARDADAGACSGIESAQAYCRLRHAQSGPNLVIANARPDTPVRAVNGDVCQDGDACRVVNQLQCDH